MFILFVKIVRSSPIRFNKKLENLIKLNVLMFFNFFGSSITLHMDVGKN